MNQYSSLANPKISILMSCYNAARWLHEAIDSALIQTFDNFELIIIDDGSSDETWDIIKSYRDKDNRIVAISKKNTGLADSLNVGIAKARGVWIARLDADDLWAPKRLEKQLDFLRDNPDVILLGTGFIEIDEHGKPIKKYHYPGRHKSLLRHLERLQRFFPHSSALYRTDVVKQLGGYNLRIKRAEDWRLWLEMALKGRMACLPELLVKIRKHSNQISCDNNGKRQLCDATASSICYFLKKTGFEDPSVDSSEKDWLDFVSWVENRLEQLGTFSKRKTWTTARSEYFASRTSLVGRLRFIIRLLQSGHTLALLQEKFLGSSLPRHLAQEWMARPSST